MKNLEVGTKINNYEVTSYKNGVYVLDDGLNRITVDMELNKVVFVEKNNRCYKAERFTNAFNYLIDSIKELETETEAETEEICDLQDVVVNINKSQIGRVVGMRDGKYRIVLSTGKLVELNRNEFYLNGENPIKEEKEVKTVKIGYYNYEVFENEYVIRFTSKALDRVFVYNKKFKDFKLMQVSTNKVLLAKRYYNNYYNIFSQLKEYIEKNN